MLYDNKFHFAFWDFVSCGLFYETFVIRQNKIWVVIVENFLVVQVRNNSEIIENC